ncbi:MAG: T9SS type A sorting domain-containing protein [Bacteroidota bacterium]
MKLIKKSILVLFILLGILSNIYAGGVVYLVIGSDTAIWAGMNTAKHDNYYDIDLYINPNRNAYQVMDPSFRDQFRDSYGTPLKMTWWMMAGNIFRYATNKNVPVPNIMTLYLMKKYHSENIILNGDELTLHYHTFYWSDYDGDGTYYWNQSKTFLESLDDFNFTLAQFLLEEETFPVSFRSGWHYMDNDWQHYLDQRVLPYSLHNDYPAKRTFDDEPIDNIFDWSEAPSEWIPYNPSYDNYQIPGDGKSWNVRSASFQRSIRNNYLDSIFAAAQNGTDQVACIWAHLPEADFLDNIVIVDSLAHQAETKYDGVTFKYCTAIEAMQLWQNVNDFNSPSLNITENISGEDVFFTITTDEEIFQTQPFIAVKNIYSDFEVVDATKISDTEWRTVESFKKSELVKVGVTATDNTGNQGMDFIEYLPADKYIDNTDLQYSEIYGNWITNNLKSWGIDSRSAQLNNSDSVSAVWIHTITKSNNYNLFVQVPEMDDPVDSFDYIIYQNSVPVDTIQFSSSLKPFNWNYLTTIYFNESDELKVQYRASADEQPGKNAITDVLKISALVKDKELNVDEQLIDLKEVSVNDTIVYPLEIFNYGITPLKINGISSQRGSLISNFSFPIEIPKMSSLEFKLQFSFTETGEFIDSLMILSDDPNNTNLMLPIVASVQEYFETVDNDETNKYQEFGEWHTSVATAFGESSRYAWLNASPLASASFNVTLRETGLYEIKYIVPTTINSTDRAIYEISIGSIIIDSVLIDQNEGSGSWVSIGKYFLPNNADINVKIIDSGESTLGIVLRADALKFELLEKLNSIQNPDDILNTFELAQNYPNPFNPSTTIKFQIPHSTHVKIQVYNLLGEKVRTLVDEFLSMGVHYTVWNGKKDDGSFVSSGPYFYRIQTDNFNESRKMIYLK